MDADARNMAASQEVMSHPQVRSTFYVNAEWEVGTGMEKHMIGQMYVERLQPLYTTQVYPIILIHGDFHTGQVWTTKPDGDPGWASLFLRHGYIVYIVDLPPVGRSNFLNGNLITHGLQLETPDVGYVERELTAPEKPLDNDESCMPAWPKAVYHNKWPGSGRRGDAIFANYYASLTSLPMTRPERQTLAQTALGELLSKTAADMQPDLVAAVVAVEPTGPPFGHATAARGPRIAYDPFTRYDPRVRPYGLADIPLTYQPPPSPLTSNPERPLDLDCFARIDAHGACILQRPVSDDGSAVNPLTIAPQKGRVRELVNLRKMPHAVVTAQASAHEVYDWATVAFLRQAGVSVTALELEKAVILGNGHLMFLERNSDEIARLVDEWLRAILKGQDGSVEIDGQGPATSKHDTYSLEHAVI